MSDGSGYNDDGELEPTTEPDWESIDLSVFQVADLEGADADSRHYAYLMTQHLVGWIVSNGMNNKDGIAIRAIVVAWLTLPVFRRVSMAELARGFGFKKQSISRWVERAKEELPHLTKQ